MNERLPSECCQKRSLLPSHLLSNGLVFGAAMAAGTAAARHSRVLMQTMTRETNIVLEEGGSASNRVLYDRS